MASKFSLEFKNAARYENHITIYSHGLLFVSKNSLTSAQRSEYTRGVEGIDGISIDHIHNADGSITILVLDFHKNIISSYTCYRRRTY